MNYLRSNFEKDLNEPLNEIEAIRKERIAINEEVKNLNYLGKLLISFFNIKYV
jgi:hypothetical protein